MKKILSMLLAISMLFSLIVLGAPAASAVDYSGKWGHNIIWELDSGTGTLTITGTGDMINGDDMDDIYDIVIPDPDIYILSPGWTSATYAEYIRHVVIEEGITSICDYAFYECSNLESIVIPQSVISIGWGAFIRCGSLKTIDLPSGLNKIDDGAFVGCTGLESIVIPDSVTSIGDQAFDDCKNLTDIDISDSVTDIGADAFSDCTSLTSIDIPDSVKKIKDGAFSRTNIEDIIIPEGVTSIPNYAFHCCESLTSVEMPETVTSIGESAFYGCKSLISIEAPEGVTSIGDAAFRECVNLTSIEIPEGVTRIADLAFYSCKSLTNIEIHENITTVGEFAFSGCESLTNIDIPVSVTSIGSNAFAWCKNLKNIIIPESVTSIGEDLLYGFTPAVIHGYWGSYAESYANASGYSFEPIIEDVKLMHTLDTSGKIALKYAVKADTISRFDGINLEAQIPVYEGNQQNGYETLTLSNPVLNGDYYYFSVPVSIWKLNDELVARLFGVKNGMSYQLSEDKYSIAQYAYSQLNKSGASNKLKSLCADILRYGSNMQIFKNYRTDALADSAMTAAHKAYLTDVTLQDNYRIHGISNRNFSWVGKTLSINEYDNTVDIRVVADVKFKNGIEDLVLSVEWVDENGQTQTCISNDIEPYGVVENRYAFTFADIPITNAKTVYSFTVGKYTNGTFNASTPTMEYSMESYGTNKTGTLRELIEAMVAYSESRNAFRN